MVVELDPNRIHWFIRRGDQFEDMRPGRDGVYRSKVFPGLWLDSESIFAGNRDRRDEVLEQGIASAACGLRGPARPREEEVGALTGP